MAVVTVAIVVAGSIWAWVRLTGTDLCASAPSPFRVVHFEGECVGTTDGSFVFAPQLAAVERDIQDENAAAVSSGNYVSVALLAPMTTGPGSVISMARITDELDGAYAEQYAADSSQSGSGPKIQLVLANEGSTEQAWQQVTSQLANMAKSPAHLVAVTGMGVSITQTQEGAQLLSRARLAMVASVLTADSLDWQHVVGLTTVVPDNLQQVRAMGSYLGSHGDLPSPGGKRGFFLVSDGQGSDMYTASLRHDFKVVFGHYISYSSPYGPPQMSGQLKVIAGEVCAAPATHGSAGVQAPTVLYAGRETLLPGFLHSLRSNPLCQHRRLTVITASDAAALPRSVTQAEPDEGSLTIIYSDLFNPGQVTRLTQQVFLKSALHSVGSLAGTWTIATYNALAAAVAATDLADTSSSPAGLPAPSSLRNYLLYLNGQNAVNGALGPFGFSSPGGSLLNPQVPVMVLAGGNDPKPAP